MARVLATLEPGGKATAGNQGIALLIFGLVFVRYLLWLRIATINLSQGKTALLEALLAGIFIAWLFPLAGSSQMSVATRRWLHLPLSLKELFRLRDNLSANAAVFLAGGRRIADDLLSAGAREEAFRRDSGHVIVHRGVRLDRSYRLAPDQHRVLEKGARDRRSCALRRDWSLCE